MNDNKATTLILVVIKISFVINQIWSSMHFPNTLLILWSQGNWSSSQLTQRKRKGLLWTGHQGQYLEETQGESFLLTRMLQPGTFFLCGSILNTVLTYSSQKCTLKVEWVCTNIRFRKLQVSEYFSPNICQQFVLLLLKQVIGSLKRERGRITPNWITVFQRVLLSLLHITAYYI